MIHDVEKIKLTFNDSEIICSLSHKFLVGDSWKEAKDMVIGDEVSGKKLVEIERVENGDVVQLTIEGAHTYICEGLLSHNKGPGRGGSCPANNRNRTRNRNRSCGTRNRRTGRGQGRGQRRGGSRGTRGSRSRGGTGRGRSGQGRGGRRGGRSGS